MKQLIRQWLARLQWMLRPQKTQESYRYEDTINTLADALSESYTREAAQRSREQEWRDELAEASQMVGVGPWLNTQLRGKDLTPARLKESALVNGAFGDLELFLQNVDWRRETQASQWTFSRWGIQDIIAISRLYYIKNPIIRRLIDVCAYYVFAQGVDISSPDEAANEVLRDFRKRNAKTFSDGALLDQQRRKYYDGNLFWAFFADTTDKGLVNARTIDAIEVMDIVTNPEDSDEEWYFQRIWTERKFDPQTGNSGSPEQRIEWYPALRYDEKKHGRPKTIRDQPVNWDVRVKHRKVGAVSKWLFGCPPIYPALDWAKESRRYLEACASVRQALAQIAITISTKGGQQALAGIKQQMQTTVGPNTQVWDTNPPAVQGSTFASGPGTQIAAFQSRGAGGDPEEVRRYLLMCCMVVGVPETFLADVSTGNLATATTLDRPTELAFKAQQQEWIEDLEDISRFVLEVSGAAPSGKLREAISQGKSSADEIEICVNFPAIREGDIPALVSSVVQAMTLGSRGEIKGIDLKTGIKLLFDLLPGVDNGDEIAEEMFPEGSYDPERPSQEEVEARDTQKQLAMIKAKQPAPQELEPEVEEAFRKLGEALKVFEDRRANGHA